MRPLLIFLLSLLLIPCSQVYGQKHNKKVFVTGTVIDVNRVPVPGAIILIDEKKTNVVTDKEGFFKLKIRPSVKIIMACTPADGAGKIEYKGQSEVSIIIDKNTPVPAGIEFKNTEEEQVNIGYGTMNKKDLTTSANSVDTRQNKYSAYSNIYDLLNGMFPGVQVIGKSIVIRGINTINSGTDPLFVVDGTVVSSIDHISPHDVKTISVLKGAESAIYGSRGANGVILIELIKAGDSLEKKK
jgi:TonB-dependent SusC/RagA subfamily outer membrane receptor